MGASRELMIRITDQISLDERDIRYEFVRASGPGGQNVNKVATAVLLRFDLHGSTALPAAVRERLLRRASSRLTQAGEVLIHARRYRTQERNRQDALDRLVSLLRDAATPPKPRRKTRRTRASVERRLQSKKLRSETKKGRRPPSGDW